MDKYIDTYANQSVVYGVYSYMRWGELRKYETIPDEVWHSIYTYFRTDNEFLEQFNDFWKENCEDLFSYQDRFLYFINYLLKKLDKWYCGDKKIVYPYILRKDKDFALHAVRLDADIWYTLDESLKQDRSIAYELVKTKRVMIEDLNLCLRQDYDLGLEAVKQNGLLLEFLGENLKSDYEIVMTAVKQYASSLQFADISLRSDRDIVLEAVKQDGCVLKYAGEILRSDRDIVFEAIKHDGNSLRFAADNLISDYEIVKAAVENNCWLKYVAKDLRGNREIVLAAVTKSKGSIAHADPILYDDYEIVLKSILPMDYIEYDPELDFLKFASPKLKRNKKFILDAVSIHPLVGRTIDPMWKSDPDVVLAVMKQHLYALDYINKNHWKWDVNRHVIGALKQNIHILDCAETNELKCNKKFILEALAVDDDVLRYASEDLRSDPEIIHAAIKENRAPLKYATDKLLSNYTFMIGIIKQYYDGVEYIGENLRSNPDFIVEAQKYNSNTIKYADLSLRSNETFMLKFIKQYGINLQILSDTPLYHNKNFRLKTKIYQNLLIF